MGGSKTLTLVTVTSLLLAFFSVNIFFVKRLKYVIRDLLNEVIRCHHLHGLVKKVKTPKVG